MAVKTAESPPESRQTEQDKAFEQAKEVAEKTGGTVAYTSEKGYFVAPVGTTLTDTGELVSTEYVQGTLAMDIETGKTHLVPRDKPEAPIELSPEQLSRMTVITKETVPSPAIESKVALDYETGKLYDVSEPAEPKEIEVPSVYDEIKKAQQALEPYKVEGKKNQYFLGEALLSRKPEVEQAAQLLFKSEDIERIKYEKAPGLTIGKPVPEISLKDEFKDLLTTHPELLSVGLVAVAEPTPFGEILVGAALAGLALSIGIRQAVESGQLRKAKYALTEAIQERFGIQDVSDVVVIDAATGQIATMQEVSEIIRQLGVLPGLRPEQIETGIPSLKPTPEVVKEVTKLQPLTPKVVEVSLLPLTPPKVPPPYGIEGYLPHFREPVVIIPGIGAMPKDLTYAERVRHGKQKAEDYILKLEQLQQAEETVKKALPKLAELPYTREQYEAVAEAARTATRAKEMDKAFADLAQQLQYLGREYKVYPDVSRVYAKAYDGYLRKKVALEEARKAYVASLNPQPITGSITSNVAAIYAAFLLAKTAAIKAYSEALNLGKTEIEAKAEAKTAAENAIQTLTEIKTLSVVQQWTLTQTQTQAVVKAAVRTATQTRVAARTLAKPAVMAPALTTTTALAMPTTTAIPVLPPPKFPRFPKTPKLVKKPKEEIQPGTVEWRHGLFWRYLEPPDYKQLKTSKRPLPGTYKFATGEGSAYKTVQVLGGMPTRDVSGIDIGIALVSIKRKGKEVTIEFKQDVADAYRGKTITEKAPSKVTNKSLGIPDYETDENGRIQLTSEPKQRTRKAYQPVSIVADDIPKRKEAVGVSTTSDRYYLGHKLRQADLGATQI